MVYAVMHAFYSDWEIYGYFTNREDAEKYCAVHSKDDLHVEELPCMDDCEDLSNVKVMYNFKIEFYKKNGTWKHWGESYEIYTDKHLKKNKLSFDDYEELIVACVNLRSRDEQLAKKIAEDILYQYLESCDCKPTQRSIAEFNKTLSGEDEEEENDS